MQGDALTRDRIAAPESPWTLPGPPLPGVAGGLAGPEVAYGLLCEGNAEVARLRLVRGAYRRTARRLRRALGLVALGASLLGVPLTGIAGAAPPVFVSGFNPFGLAAVGTRAAPATADLDGDGDLDAVIGNQDGNTVVFENTGTASAPAFAASVVNPFGLADIGIDAAPALADLDGDGDLDALIGEFAGNTVFFENTGTASVPAFAASVVNPFGLATVGFDAVPTLADLDGDGDLDALIGNSAGNSVFFENTGTASAPAFAASVVNPFGLADVGNNAAPTLADLDGDGDLDALIGNSAGNTFFFANTGTASVPAFAASVVNPFGLAGVGNTATPTLADLDGDGDLDALIGNADGNTVVFPNTGTATGPAFDASFSNPFGLADVGNNAAPTLADLDGDGDLDALIGNNAGYTFFFENTGTASAPAFAASVLNPFGLADVGNSAAPALADLDGDGDLDALIGNYAGNTFFFENTGTASAPAFAAAVVNPFGLAGVGNNAAPTLADLDGDGDLDALIGNYAGNIFFFENTGTASAPAFAAAVVNPFGLAAVGSYVMPALADLDGDGDLDALIGNYAGNTVFFENTGTATTPAFAAAVVNPFGLADVGNNAAPTLADLDGDGHLDALIGKRDGNTVLFVAVLACPETPAPGCTAGFEKGGLFVNETKPGREKLVASLGKGPAIAQADLGNPTVASGTAYALCFYDDADSLASALTVDRAGELCGTKPCWKSLGGAPPSGKGYAYKDKAAAASGVTKLQLKSGAAGKPKITLKAANNAAKGQTALRTGIAAALASTAIVEMQLIGSNGSCYAVTLDVILKFPGFLKAK